jgi:release factor glutamine methyltransferase
MTINAYKDHFISALSPLYDKQEAERFFLLLLEAYQGLKRIDVALDPSKALPDADLPKWNDALEKLRREVPIQYIIGKAHFYGLSFEVNPAVLIPRPETEELVDWIIRDLNAQAPGRLDILDIGTGSGCIAVSLAKNLQANVSAIDVSPDALETAKSNAKANNVAVDFIRQDILDTEDLDQSYDVIASNPPYVRHLEKHEIRRNVLDNEPHLALFVDDNDALLFYDKIASLAAKSLAPDGTLYFEINQYLAKETMDLLERNGFSFLELRKDLSGNDRMVKARL